MNDGSASFIEGGRTPERVTHGDAPTAVIAKRADEHRDPDTTEIRQLARAAGYEIAGEITQSITEDPEYHLGSGKVDEVFRTVVEEDADVVIFDNQLGPYQTYNVGLRLPDDTEVIDRYRLIIEIFGQRADTRTAQLQVELARLRYELPRAEAKASLAKRDERPGFMGLGEYDESRERDIKKRISRIQDELDRIQRVEANRREQRREQGFDLVALAGYTNAGKSTLLQRLATSLEVGQNDDLHHDIDPTARAQDTLFTTLGTTTRRMELATREALLTDTVGFIRNLPHWLVESFKSTLDSVYRADLVLLVVDATESVEEIREKLITSHDVLRDRNEARIVTVLNKIDAVDDEELRRKRDAITGVAPNPVEVSAATGMNIDDLRTRIEAELPALREERVRIPASDEAMSLVSWIHDNAHVHDVEYTDGEVVVDFEAREKTVGQAQQRVSEIENNHGEKQESEPQIDD